MRSCTGSPSKLNDALKGHDALAKKSVEELLADLNALPADIRSAVRNNGGGHANHTLFWKIMKPGGGGEPQGELADALKSAFGSMEDVKSKVNAAGAAQFGSGWTWIFVKKGKLEIGSTANQDTPISQGATPILGIDVWEHAYYLHYQNRRPDYLNAWWNTVNWDQVAANLKAAG